MSAGHLTSLPCCLISICTNHSYTTFRAVNLPDTPSLTVCVNLRLLSSCPTLGDFCYGYDYSGSCQYMLANKAQSCCPTSMTTSYRVYGKH